MNIDEINVTADLHFGHRKMLEIRDFDTIEGHDETLIEMWNSKSDKHTVTYVIGDFSMHRPEMTSKILSRLNGNKILIKGNHDHTKAIKATVGWHSVLLRHNLKIDDLFIVMHHEPILSWERVHYGSYHLHGHCHGNMVYPEMLQCSRILDVGVDNMYSASGQYAPFKLKDVIRELSILGPTNIGHHSRKTVLSSTG